MPSSGKSPSFTAARCPHREIKRFLPGLTCCSSCSGERVPNNLSTRSTFDFHPRSAASTSEFSVLIVIFLFQLPIESYVEFNARSSGLRSHPEAASRRFRHPIRGSPARERAIGLNLPSPQRPPHQTDRVRPHPEETILFPLRK